MDGRCRTVVVAMVVAAATVLGGCATAVPGRAAPAADPAPDAASAPVTPAPPVVRTIAELAAAPCLALSAGQVRELGHQPPGAQVAEDPGYGDLQVRCRWFGYEGGISLFLSAGRGVPAGEAVAPLSGSVPVTVAGFPGTTYPVGSFCTLGVDLPTGGLVVSTSRTDEVPVGTGCDGAVALAEVVIGNLATGVPVDDPAAVPALSVVDRWAADPCAALSPAAVAAAVGAGATSEPEEFDSLEAGCRWTGPAGTLRLVAVLLDILHPPEAIEALGRPSAVGSRAVVEVVEGTTCTVYARFPAGKALLLTVDDPVAGAEPACARARSAAAELLAV